MTLFGLPFPGGDSNKPNGDTPSSQASRLSGESTSPAQSSYPERSHRPQILTSANSLPLSMQLFKYCPTCNCGGGGDSSWHRADRDDDDDMRGDPSSRNDLLADYDLQALRRQNSAASPMVVAPMMLSSTPHHLSKVERLITEYMMACRFYGCGNRINAGVLTTIRFSLPSLRVSGSFHDADMLALCEILLRYANGPLSYIKRLDFSIASREGKPGFRSHGALALSKVLQQSQHIEEVFLSRNRLGPYGATAIFIACSTNPTVKRLRMRRCRVGERGALAFAELIVSSSETGLEEVDLSANYAGFKGCLAIEKALVKRGKDLSSLAVDIEGNLVLQQIMNAVTHGLGVLLAFLGSWLLSHRVRDMSHIHKISCAVYSTSLVILYMSSTLYHSFFTMQYTKYIFEVFDKCAIYILIAGSYTPFLQVVLWHEPLYSVYLLSFIWVCCFLGICVEALFPSWPQKPKFSLAMYLGMGWSCLVCLPEVARSLPENALNMMILGGVGYTAGVPFFVRNNNLDHAIWHLFVLAGSFCHWLGIFLYVATVRIGEQDEVHSSGWFS